MQRKIKRPRLAPVSATAALPLGYNSHMPSALLTRQQAGAALRAAGYPVADKTLATMATRGGGPAYRRFGARVLYVWGEALAWAESRLSAPIRSTSENDAPEPN